MKGVKNFLLFMWGLTTSFLTNYLIRNPKEKELVSIIAIMFVIILVPTIKYIVNNWNKKEDSIFLITKSLIILWGALIPFSLYNKQNFGCVFISSSSIVIITIIIVFIIAKSIAKK